MAAPITRKEFCTRMAGGSVVLLFQACGGGGSDYVAPPAPAPTPGPGPSGCNDTIGLFARDPPSVLPHNSNPISESRDLQGGVV